MEFILFLRALPRLFSLSKILFQTPAGLRYVRNYVYQAATAARDAVENQYQRGYRADH